MGVINMSDITNTPEEPTTKEPVKKASAKKAGAKKRTAPRAKPAQTVDKIISLGDYRRKRYGK